MRPNHVTLALVAHAVLLFSSIILPARLLGQGAELTANVGWMSQYLYRGIPQHASSASTGLDLGMGPLYLGTWAADVGDGSEVDVYGGYAFDLGPVGVSAGGTGYFYTGGFDDSYVEGNLGVGVGLLTADFAIGSYRTDPGPLTYTYLELTAETRGLHLSAGTFGSDFSGEYAEIGYALAISGTDVLVSWVLSDGELALLPSGRSDATLVLGVSRTFTLR